MLIEKFSGKYKKIMIAHNIAGDHKKLYPGAVAETLSFAALPLLSRRRYYSSPRYLS